MDDLVFFYPSGHEKHQHAGHPERPDRIEAAVEGLEQAGYWQKYPHLEPLSIPPEILSGVHTRAYLSVLETACTRYSFVDPDTYTTPYSYPLAMNAAGGAAACAREVWQGKAKRGFALCRPPGHHAGPGYALGFCLINNAAAAAEYLIRAEGAGRLAIVDLDLHHGNGTQDIFYARPDVLYLSTHQTPLFPGSGRVVERGRGEGLGATANFPLPAGSGDEAFRTVMERGILPLLERFDPQMVLVSQGFDTHWRDPIGSLGLTVTGTGASLKSLVDFADRRCGGRLAVILEGGYDLEAMAACSAATAAVLLGEPFDDPFGPSPYLEGERWKGSVEQALKAYDL